MVRSDLSKTEYGGHVPPETPKFIEIHVFHGYDRAVRMLAVTRITVRMTGSLT